MTQNLYIDTQLETETTTATRTGSRLKTTINSLTDVRYKGCLEIFLKKDKN